MGAKPTKATKPLSPYAMVGPSANQLPSSSLNRQADSMSSCAAAAQPGDDDEPYVGEPSWKRSGVPTDAAMDRSVKMMCPAAGGGEITEDELTGYVKQHNGESAAEYRVRLGLHWEVCKQYSLLGNDEQEALLAEQNVLIGAGKTWNDIQVNELPSVITMCVQKVSEHRQAQKRKPEEEPELCDQRQSTEPAAESDSDGPVAVYVRCSRNIKCFHGLGDGHRGHCRDSNGDKLN
jgi:hypothetical protein